MSRSAAKSRADKGGRRSSVQVNTPQTQDPDVEEIVPGRLTQAQWTDLLRQEDAEEIVGEIMEEVLSQVTESWFKGYIQRQLGHFSTSWAHDYLVQVLEWQFLYRDEGEGPEEASRTEDLEPLPASADSWAQGCVPVINTTLPPHPTSQQEAAIGQIAGETEPKANQQCHVMAQSGSPKQSEKDRNPSKPADCESYRILTPRPPPRSDQKKRRQIHSLPNTVEDKLLWSPSGSIEKNDKEKQGGNRVHLNSSHRLESLHKHEDYQPIPRLSHVCLPQHYVTPQYEILDTNHTKSHPKRPSGLSIAERRCDKQQTEWMGNSLKPLTNHLDQPAKLQGRNGADVWLSLRKKASPTGRKREGIIPFSGTLRLDTMDLVQGVSLKDSQGVQLSPLKMCPPAQSTRLRPMQANPVVPLFSAEQLTTGTSPQVTSLY